MTRSQTLSNAAYALLLLFSLVCFATQTQARDKTHLTFYAGMSGVMSPFLEYHPVLPITAEEAKTIPHYRVTRDPKGRLQEIAWFNKDKPESRSYFLTHKVSYEYRDDNTYSRRYFDINGQPASMWRHYYKGGDIHEERYFGTPDVREVKLFNERGERVESGMGAHHFVAKKIDNRRFLQHQFSLAGLSALFRQSMPFIHTLISVDLNGYLDKVINVEPETLTPLMHPVSGFAAMKVYFAENGLELGWGYLNEKGSLVNLPMTDPNEPGAAYTLYFKQWRNERLNQWQTVYGRYYDKTGGVIADKQGVYLLQMEKDELNRMTSISYYGRDGELVMVESEGFARKEFDYSGNSGEPLQKLFDADYHLIQP